MLICFSKIGDEIYTLFFYPFSTFALNKQDERTNPFDVVNTSKQYDNAMYCERQDSPEYSKISHLVVQDQLSLRTRKVAIWWSNAIIKPQAKKKRHIIVLGFDRLLLTFFIFL